MPLLLLGQVMPDFSAETTSGKINFHEFLDTNSWCVLFSHPRDLTPVCTTELAELVRLTPEFERRNVKTICLSCDPLENHQLWAKDILYLAGKEEEKLPFPIIADPKGKLAREMGLLDGVEKDRDDQLLTCRAVVIFGPPRTVKLIVLYPATTGRNFREILRTIDSLMLTDNHGLEILTPVNWEVGEDCIVTHKLYIDDAKRKYPDLKVTDLPSKECYLRYISYDKCPRKTEDELARRNSTTSNTTIPKTAHRPYRTNMR